MQTFTCSHGGEEHSGPPLAYSTDAPTYYYAASEEEQAKRSVLTEERCVMDGQHFFVRARIVLHVADADAHFEWGVWVSLSEANYRRRWELRHTEGRESEPPCFGWLSTRLPGYPDTLNPTRPI